MPRRNRDIPTRKEGTLVEVSTRCLHATYLLTPTAELTDLAVGCLGRALEVSPLELCAMSMLSNHYHALVVVEDQQQLSRFMGHFNGNLAREVARIVDWPEKVWARRFDAIRVSDEPEAQWARLKYVLSQGAKEGLVESPLDWEGLHAARPLATGGHLQGHWFNRTEEYEARRRGEDFQKYDYATLYRVEFDRLPCARHLTDEEYGEKIAQILREIEDEAAQARGDSPVLGMPSIRRQDPCHRPPRTKRSPKPRFHTVDREHCLSLVAEHRAFLSHYREASRALRSGDPGSSMGFPMGCYPPALPFVGAFHEPWTPPSPPTRPLFRGEKGDIVDRGEIPVVPVPRRRSGRSPPSPLLPKRAQQA